MSIKISNIILTGFDGFVASADVSVGEVEIRDVKLIRKKDGTYFLGMPSRKITNNDKTEYITICGISNSDIRRAVIRKFVELYKALGATSGRT